MVHFFNRALIFWLLLQPLQNSYGISKPPQFDPRNHAQTQDWQLFWKSSDAFRHDLWSFFSQQGVRFEDWSWTWRVGWLKVCQNSRLEWCKPILESGLFDKAAVVRAQAAISTGRYYHETNDPKILDLLAKSYQLPLNFRNKQPLFPCARLLEAIYGVGGLSATKLAMDLADQHQNTKTLVGKLFQPR